MGSALLLLPLLQLLVPLAADGTCLPPDFPEGETSRPTRTRGSGRLASRRALPINLCPELLRFFFFNSLFVCR